MSLLALLLLSAVPVDSFAVVVGENRQIGAATHPLSYADDDAVMTHRLLTEAGVQSSLLVQLDADSAPLFSSGGPGLVPPTRAALLQTLERTFDSIRDAQSRGTKTRLYFVYSGHGDVSDGQGYVALRDARLTRTFLHEQILARSPADENHIIIDACRSYFVVFGKGPGGQRRTHNLILQDTRDRFPNTGFVLSTSSDRDSHEWARFRGGIFSHEVRSGLRGGADIDLNAAISYNELSAFIDTANKTLSNSRYRPDSVILPPRTQGAQPDVLLSWGASDTLMVTDEASLGHMVLEDSRGVRLADAHPAPGQKLLLRTPTSRPLFLRGFEGNEEYVINQPGPAVVLSQRRTSPPAVLTRGPAHLAFRMLFSAPFGPAVLRAFDPLAHEVRFTRPEVPLSSRLLSTTRTVAPWVSLGTAAVGAALTTAAVVERGRASQVDLPASNARITQYNRGAVAAYSVAAVSGLVWLALELFSTDS